MIQPPSTLLLGGPGSGKTTSLLTLCTCGIELFVIVTEPNGVDSLLDAAKMFNVDVNLLHWKVVSPASPGFAALQDMAKMVNALSYKDLSELKGGIGKEQMKSLPILLSTLDNFVCDRTGKAYGDVTKLGPQCAFSLDSLSGLNMIAMQHTVGFKPSPHQGEWGIAMSMEEQILLKLAADSTSFFVLTSHLDKEPDELTGTTKIMASALGRKLAPKIPRFFSEVVLAKRGATEFTWSTMSDDADLKNRALPASKSMKPSFEPIFQAYKRRVEQQAKEQSAATSTPMP